MHCTASKLLPYACSCVPPAHQGKTSRWALAWSFAADPSAASKPLPRFPSSEQQAAGQPQAAGQQQQQPTRVPTGRKLSWQVHAPPREGPAVLDAVQGCLQAAGVACTLDRAAYSVRGSYMPNLQERAAAEDGAGAPAAKRLRGQPGGGGGGGSSGDAAAGPSSAAHPWCVELHLFQQHPGLFLLSAALPPSTPAGALGWFGGLAQQLQRALGERWKVQA